MPEAYTATCDHFTTAPCTSGLFVDNTASWKCTDAPAIKPLINTIALRGTCNVLSQMTSERQVNRALATVGLRRSYLDGPAAFVPLGLLPIVLEDVARQTGERHIGMLAGGNTDYWQYGPYAEYVLDGETLGAALRRGRRGLPFIWPGATFTLRNEGEFVVARYAMGIPPTTSTRHNIESAPLVLVGLVRRFLGSDWQPEWIELPPSSVNAPYDRLGLSRCEVRPGQIPGIAVLAADLETRNPRLRLPESASTFAELAELAPDGVPRSTSEVVVQIARQKLFCGDLTLDSVAEDLDVGPRTLQRRLRVEGVSFREVTKKVIAERARALLLESDHTVEEIARSLGYEEVNSFRRAFRSCYGMSPSSYRPSQSR